MADVHTTLMTQLSLPVSSQMKNPAGWGQRCLCVAPSKTLLAIKTRGWWEWLLYKYYTERTLLLDTKMLYISMNFSHAKMISRLPYFSTKCF